MKKCAICKTEKNKKDFNKNKDKKDGLSNVCRECNKISSKNYYKENGKKHRETVSVRNSIVRKRNIDYINNIKLNSKCSCGESDVSCLDFHHKNRHEKENDICTLKGFSTIEKIQKEIDKCIIICSNCHRKLHAGSL